MLEAVRQTFGDRAEVTGENAGIHMVVWLRDVAAGRLDDLIARAAKRGIGIYSVVPHYMTPPDTAGLLLGYAGLTEREIHDGIHQLGAVVTAGQWR
jgi:GntR family transcriptional regulator / MocR family aminotransferase